MWEGHTMASVAARFVFFGADRDPSLFYEDRHPLPHIEEGEILTKIRLATLCGSDLHTLQGKRVEAVPSVLGHEAVGEVIATRRVDAKVKVGDRVTFSIIDSCFKCWACRSGLPQKCQHMKKYGHLSLSDHGGGFNGCYASHLVLRAGTEVFPIPDSVTDREAAPINCALATMMSATESIPNNEHYKTAVIQGAGLLGLYGCAILRERGFKHVWCMDIDQNRLLMVPRFGGIPSNSNTYQMNDDGPEPDSVDVVVEVCGVKSVVKQGLTLLRPGGQYILVGLVHPDSQLDITAETLIRKCLTVRGVHNYAPHHLEKAVEFIANTNGKYPYDSLLSPVHNLKDLIPAVRLANSRRYPRVAVQPMNI